jgi:hypothetical protein
MAGLGVDEPSKGQKQKNKKNIYMYVCVCLGFRGGSFDFFFLCYFLKDRNFLQTGLDEILSNPHMVPSVEVFNMYIKY